MPTFPAIAASRRDVDSPFDEDMADDLHDRDEGLREQIFFLLLAEVSETNAAYQLKQAWPIEVPIWAKILKVALDTKVTATTTGTYKGTLGALDSDEPTETGAAYVPSAPTFLTWSDVSSLAGTTVDLELRLKNSPGGGGNTTFAQQIEGPACYWSA